MRRCVTSKRCVGDGYDAVGAIHGDLLTRGDLTGRAGHADDGGDAVLASNHGAVRVGAAHLHDQASSGEKHRRPSGISGWSNEDLARLEMSADRIEDDSRSPGD